jgi:hypothetical protein
MKKDYMCYLTIGGGCCYGYGETPTEAVSNMLIELPAWSTYYKLSEVVMTSSIYDVSQYDGFCSDHRGVFGQLPDKGEGDLEFTEKPMSPTMYAKVKTPKARKQKSEWGHSRFTWSELSALRSAVKTQFFSTYEELEEDDKAA